VRFRRGDFVATCGQTGCGRRRICLPGTDLDERTRSHKIRSLEPWAMRGYWTAMATLYIYVPERMPSAKALRYHQGASKSRWRLICSRCLGQDYLERVRFDLRSGLWAGSLFGLKLSASLRAIRNRKDPSSVLDRLVPELEREILKELRWLHLPRWKRRKLNDAAMRRSGCTLASCYTLIEARKISAD